MIIKLFIHGGFLCPYKFDESVNSGISGLVKLYSFYEHFYSFSYKYTMDIFEFFFIKNCTIVYFEDLSLSKVTKRSRASLKQLKVNKINYFSIKLYVVASC